MGLYSMNNIVHCQVNLTWKNLGAAYLGVQLTTQCLG